MENLREEFLIFHFPFSVILIRASRKSRAADAQKDSD